jgi:hypothetical protein
MRHLNNNQHSKTMNKPLFQKTKSKQSATILPTNHLTPQERFLEGGCVI